MIVRVNQVREVDNWPYLENSMNIIVCNIYCLICCELWTGWYLVWVKFWMHCMKWGWIEKLNTWVITLIGIISICLITILKLDKPAMDVPIRVMKPSKRSLKNTKSVLFYWYDAKPQNSTLNVENVRGSALSVASTVPSDKNCEKNGVERWPSGAQALGPLQVWNKN